MSGQEESSIISFKTGYLLILLPLISCAAFYSLSTTSYHLYTTTHFHVDTIANTLSYNLNLTLSVPHNNFLGIHLVSVHTSPTFYSVRRLRSSVVRSQLFVCDEHVTWSGWNSVVCSFSSEEYYKKEPMGEFSIHFKVYLQSSYEIGALTVPFRSTAECWLELPLSTAPNGAYGGYFGPTKCG